MLSLGEPEPGVRVVDGDGHADVDAADVVDHVHQPGVAELDEVVETDAGLLLDRLPEAGRPAVGERLVDLLDPARVGLLPGPARPLGAGIDRDHRVARDVHHRHQVTAGGDVHNHDRLGYGVA